MGNWIDRFSTCRETVMKGSVEGNAIDLRFNPAPTTVRSVIGDAAIDRKKRAGCQTVETIP
jgi:hypothetical protein